MLSIGSLFSGIGGLELGLEWAGLGPVVWQVEKDPFCRSVLGRHWPDVQRFDDVREFEGRPADLICGGFPCQDISSAGKGAGLTGERSGLWFEFARVLEQSRPAWAVVENVASGARRWVDAVCAHLGQLGYETLPVPMSAADVGAPHLRRRIFVVAYSERNALRIGAKRLPGGWSAGIRRQGQAELMDDGNKGPFAGLPAWSPAPEIPRMDAGVSGRVDRERALGNAVVPQCSEVIGHIVATLARDAA